MKRIKKNRKLRRLATVVCAACLILSQLCGCGSQQTPEAGSNSQQNADAQQNAQNTQNTQNSSQAASSSAPVVTAAVLPDRSYSGDPKTFMNGNARSEWWEGAYARLEASQEVSAGMESWYAQFLSTVLGESDANQIVSPLNAYLALTLLAETAAGDTRAEILDALNVPDIETLRTRAAALWDANYEDTPVIQSQLANALFLNSQCTYEQDTLDRLASEYHADAVVGEMGTEEMNRQLAEWTNSHTGNLLESFASEMSTDPRTLMEIVSTLYFKTAWSEPFLADASDEGTFHGLSGDAACTMMHHSATSTFYWGSNFSALSLGLSEGGAMYFFLPDEGSSPSDVAACPQVLELIENPYDYENQAYRIVNLSIPRFDVRTKTDLMDYLPALGITLAANPTQADFTALSPMPDIFLAKADHAACVIIDEEGVTGAAYTDLGLCGAGAPPDEEIDFVVDRPFFFVITARDGSLLFAGKVADLQ